MDRARRRIVSRKKRAFRVRKKIIGTGECPRFCIKRSLKNISVQIIDDIKSNTIVSAGSFCKNIADKKGTKLEIAKIVGESIAEKALEKGIKKVVFDRKGYPYNGRIKALAEASRNKGLKF